MKPRFFPDMPELPRAGDLVREAWLDASRQELAGAPADKVEGVAIAKSDFVAANGCPMHLKVTIKVSPAQAEASARMRLRCFVAVIARLGGHSETCMQWDGLGGDPSAQTQDSWATHCVPRLAAKVWRLDGLSHFDQAEHESREEAFEALAHRWESSQIEAVLGSRRWLPHSSGSRL